MVLMKTPFGKPGRVRRGVIGIIVRDDRFLVVRRAAGIARPGCWCFPGGHVEPGETSRQAVIREMQEELGVVVRPHRRLGSLRIMASRHILAAWIVEHVSGAIVPAPAEVAECRWVTFGEIEHLEPGLPSNRTVMAMLKNRLSIGE